MEQNYNNSQNEFLWKLLANPADDAHLYNYNVQRLVNDFPQSGLLQALLAHTSDEKNLKQASVYFNPRSLYKLVNTPENFPVVQENQIVTKFSNPTPPAAEAYQQEEASTVMEAEIDHPAAPSFTESHTPEPVAQTAGVTHEEPIRKNNIADQVLAAIKEYRHIAEEAETEEKKTQESPAGYHHHEAEENIEDEIFEEIAPVENIGVLHPIEPEAPEQLAQPIEQRPAAETAAKMPADNKPNFDDEADRLIVGNIAATDFFMFDRAFGDQKPAAQAEEVPTNTAPVAEPGVKDEKAEPAVSAAGKDAKNEHVSMYNDDKMPYSFMWWLDKTRREHSGVYQPFVGAAPETQSKKAKGATDELQQQYYENIFHLTSIEELEKSAPPTRIEFGRKKKEHVIIERFIQEEPQIKPQSSDKLDNENKAKKSSEDRDELVTETLAGIYVEQMLYHKAISSYKKLMLKFPEKSRYFAGKIEQLEKRTN
ncbi:hypothetical protein BH09BAC6_BH09BAC6_13730 [soil metagenome]